VEREILGDQLVQKGKLSFVDNTLKEASNQRLGILHVVDRMGAEFYSQVFGPAVREARANGETYESMRDRLRRRWKPVAPDTRS